MPEPFIGQIVAVAFNFAPQGWLPCDGRTLDIAQYPTLFTLIGTTYGGDGQQSFNLPSLNGRAARAVGQGTGLPPSTLGTTLGSESVALNAAQNGAHTHTLKVTSQAATTATPGQTMFLAQYPGTEAPPYAPATGATTTMSSTSTSLAGGSQPHENRQPWLAITYMIATEGVFPTET